MTQTKTILTEATPLFVLARRNIPEVVVDGVGYFRRQGAEITGSDPETQIVARSLLKPWQYLAAGITADEAYWSLGLASHSGQSQHMEALERLSQYAAAGENELFCPRGYPLDPSVAAQLRLSGEQPTRMHHPCSGKHLLFMAACRRNDWPLESYWDTEHPMQKKVYSVVGQNVGEKPVWMTDSCGVPTIAVSAKAHLTLWERLALSEEPDQVRLKQLWTENPRLTGGYGRLDSDIMELEPGKVLAKEGADGLLMVQSLPADDQPVATCFVKLSPGYDSAHLALALWSVLSRQSELPPVFANLTEYLRSRLETWIPRDQQLVLPPFDSL